MAASTIAFVVCNLEQLFLGEHERQKAEPLSKDGHVDIYMITCINATANVIGRGHINNQFMPSGSLKVNQYCYTTLIVNVQQFSNGISAPC